MKNEKWLIVILLAVIGYLIYKSQKPKELSMGMGMPKIRAVGNPGAKQLQAPKTTKLLAERVIVATSGTPVQFPLGKPVSEVRLSTADNTGTIFLGTSYVEARDAKHRFAIATGSNINLPFKVADLSQVWCDCDTNNDGVSILAEVESN